MSSLYYWGQLPNAPHSPETPITLNTNIRGVSSGKQHVVMWGEEEVLGMGSNSEGQLGKTKQAGN